MQNPNLNESEIPMDWQAVRKVLRQTKSRGESANPQETKLREYFGNEKFEKLRELSTRAEEIRNELGNIVLLPGIMGSQLVAGGDRIWLNYWRIAIGNLERLRLGDDGKTNFNGEEVVASDLIGSYYGYALEYLQADPFAYDWRLDLDDTADKLAEFIKANYNGQKVKFVAHSMGGLVVRNFIHRHLQLWKDIDGKLIMLGTPNRGAIAATQALIGKNSVQTNLAWLDVPHSQSRIVDIICSFPGVYQLLPSPNEENKWLYEMNTWQGFPVVSNHLQRGSNFQDVLNKSSETIDPTRMFYIAGVGSETPSALQVNNGNYYYTFTMQGDGTVPHDTGRLEGVPTYYVEEAHADLPNNDLVLKAVKEIILNGKASSLTTEAPAMPRALSTNSERKITEEKIVREIESIGQSIRDGNFNEDVAVWATERKLMGVLLGGKVETTPLKTVEETTAETFAPATLPNPKDAVKVIIEPILGNITTANAPTIVVGQYQNVPLTGASAAIDESINYWITLAHQSGMIGAELGQLFFIPVKKSPYLDQSVESVILAGMGKYGEFSREDLRYLMMNATSAVLAMKGEAFATVLVGTSLDTFSIDRAVRSLVLGISDALDRQINGRRIKTLTILLAEKDLSRQKQIQSALGEVANQIKEDRDTDNRKLPFGNIELEVKDVDRRVAKKPKRVKKTPFFVLPDAERRNVTRVTVDRFLGKVDPQNQKCEEGTFRLSILTSRATIPIREINVQDFLIDEIAEKLRQSRDTKVQEEFGKLLHSILIPEDFQSLIDSNKQLVLMMNREAAQIPWEMISFGDTKGVSNFGRDLNLSRQFSSLLVNVPSVAPAINNAIKALIIADPAPDARLPGAEAEGRKLSNLFAELKVKFKSQIDLQFQTKIGPSECDLAEILSLIFNEEFDLIHFAGHGSFDLNQPTQSGWVFGKNRILSANEIFRLRRVPRLVFANACFSGNLPASESNNKLAGLAEAFFRKGIENYIGTGWAVDDEYALNFAEVFYRQILQNGETLGEALREARETIWAGSKNQIDRPDSTWAAYQHYGDANTRLVR